MLKILRVCVNCSKALLINQRSSKWIIAVLILVLICRVSYAQQKNTLSDLFYFIGKWEGQGQFAMGKKIEASLNFRLALDSSWLLVEHTDKSPNRYKSIGLWGIDKRSGLVMASFFDKFSGRRDFVCNGWKENMLLLNYSEVTQPGSVYKHFIYQHLTDTTFKMSYEVSKDSLNWRFVDSLVFVRSGP